MERVPEAVPGLRPSNVTAGEDISSAPLGSCSPSLLRRTEPMPGLLLYEASDRDSFPGIAVRFNTTPSILQRLNKLSSQFVFPGQKLLVPDPSSPAGVDAVTQALTCSQVSSGVSCCSFTATSSGDVAGGSRTSSRRSVGEVTSATSTSSSSGCSIARGDSSTGSSRVLRQRDSAPGTTGMVTNDDKNGSGSGTGDGAIVMVDSYFSPVGKSSRGSDKGPGSTVSSGSMLPSNHEPLPLEVVTDCLVAIDAQYMNVEEGIARGTLRITKDRISFQPWGADRLVKLRGPECFTCATHWSAVSSVSLYSNLVDMSVRDRPLPMSRQSGRPADFLFVSCDDWSLVAPRVHCTKATELPLRSASSEAMAAATATSSGDSYKSLSPSASAVSSGSSAGSRLSPAMRLRAALTPPMVKTSSAGSRTSLASSGVSPGASPQHGQSGGVDGGSSANGGTSRATGRRLSLFRQRSATDSAQEAKRSAMSHLLLPGYLCVRMQPLTQEASEPEKELVFAIPGAKKELLFDFFSHSLPKIKNVSFADLSVLYDNLRDAEYVRDGADVDGAAVAAPSVLRVVSPSSDGSPQRIGGDTSLRKHRSASLGSSDASRRMSSTSLRRVSAAPVGGAHGASIDDSWDVLNHSDAEPPRVARSTSVAEAPTLETESHLLTVEQLINLSKELPLHLLGTTWRLAYSTDVHGISMQTLYRNCRAATDDGPVLLVVRDAEGHVFGVLSSCTLRVCDTYEGNGTSFLFSFHRDDKCQVFRWMGTNSFFFKGDMDCISFGGGRGKFGLWLDADFHHGASHPCVTYDNSCLSHQNDFMCAGVEAWHFH